MKTKQKLCFLMFLLFFVSTTVAQQQISSTKKKVLRKQDNNEEFNYQLVYFDTNNYILHGMSKKTVIPKGMKKEDKVKLIVEDLLSISDDELKKQGLKKAIKPKVKIENVKCLTETHKTLDNIEIHHDVVTIEFSRDIIPYLDPVTLEDLTTQIRFTLEFSGIKCTKLELITKDKNGKPHSLMHFLDNKEE